jgi:hypothetical protein
MGKSQATKKSKIYTYPVSAAWTEDGVKMSYMTQLYQVGVYIIFNNDSSMQGNMKPSQMLKLVKKLKDGEKAGRITGLCPGCEISVSNKTGFWENEATKEKISIAKGSLLKTENN